jgi:putative hemolysin
MGAPRHNAARDISYAFSAETRGGRAMIRLMENTTGRLGLIKRARGYEEEVAAGRDFFEVMIARYGLSMDVRAGCLDDIPASGPLIVIANHPYGILDGLIMGHILQSTRGDFRILANSLFRKAEDVDRVVLPISFEETKAAIELNLATRKRSFEYLAGGGAIGVFPGGTVSTAVRPFSRPMDPGWRSFTARMISKSGATVLPVYFHGHNSRLFQIASHLHLTLRLGLLINEFGKRVDTPVRISIGAPIGPDALAPFATDSKAMMDFLRKATYELSPEIEKSFDLGYDFEERHRS